MPIETKRVYERLEASDGCRILIDGLWPRGLIKEKLKIEAWMREIAPSPALRKWYGHRPEKWPEFRRRYREELLRPPRKELLAELVARARKEKVTLVFAARDLERSNATVVAEMIRNALQPAPGES